MVIGTEFPSQSDTTKKHKSSGNWVLATGLLFSLTWNAYPSTFFEVCLLGISSEMFQAKKEVQLPGLLSGWRRIFTDILPKHKSHFLSPLPNGMRVCYFYRILKYVVYEIFSYVWPSVYKMLFHSRNRTKAFQDCSLKKKKKKAYIRLMASRSSSNIANSVFSFHLTTVSNLHF